MSAALQALLAARRAGIAVSRDGDGLDLAARSDPPADILEALRRYKAPILELLATERCEACRGLGTPDQPLLECSYAGHGLRLHHACIADFLKSAAAADDRYEPEAACDECCQPGVEGTAMTVAEGQRHIAHICELIREAGFSPKDFFNTQPPAPDRKDKVATTRWLKRERQRRAIAHSMACYGFTAHDLAVCWPRSGGRHPDSIHGQKLLRA